MTIANRACTHGDCPEFGEAGDTRTEEKFDEIDQLIDSEVDPSTMKWPKKAIEKFDRTQTTSRQNYLGPHSIPLEYTIHQQPVLHTDLRFFELMGTLYVNIRLALSQPGFDLNNVHDCQENKCIDIDRGIIRLQKLKTLTNNEKNELSELMTKRCKKPIWYDRSHKGDTERKHLKEALSNFYESLGILYDKLVQGNTGTTNTGNMYRRWKKYDKETNTFPVILSSLKYLTEPLGDELFESGFGLQLLNAVKKICVSYVILSESVFSCSFFGDNAWEKPLLKEKLPLASKNYNSGFELVKQLFHYSKLPRNNPTVHGLVAHWQDIIRHNPLSTPTEPAGTKFFDEGLLEATNRPGKQGLKEFAQKNVPVQKAVSQVFKRLCFQNNPRWYMDFSFMKPKYAVTSRCLRILDDLADESDRASSSPPRVSEYPGSDDDEDENNLYKLFSTKLKVYLN